MEPFFSSNHPDSITDERRAFVRLAAAVSRLDEASVSGRKTRDMHAQGAIRREAIAITGLEGSLVRMEVLATLIDDPEETSVDRGALIAFGIHKAMLLAADWPEGGPSSDEVSDVFKTSDEAHGRLMRPEAIWSLEDDSEWMSHELSRASETREPWTAVEVVRSIWSSGRFFGNSRRMAMIAAPWLMRAGFDLGFQPWGAAAGIGKNVDQIRNASQDKDSWAIAFADAAAAGYGAELTAFRNVPALVTSLKALCPPERSSSSVVAAIEHFIGNPVSSSKTLSSALGLSDRGAKVVLDKMVDAGVLDVEGGVRNRRFVCRRVM